MKQTLRHRFLDHLRVERGFSRNTIAAYQQTIVRLEQYLQDKNLELHSATRADLRGFLFTLGDKRAASTLARWAAQAVKRRRSKLCFGLASPSRVKKQRHSASGRQSRERTGSSARSASSATQPPQPY